MPGPQHIDDEADELIPTRRSLLSRLKDWDDQESWRNFFDTYWRLIYRTALKSGLNDAEAQDVVQETILSVLKKIGEFRYDPQKSFKAWLLQLTRWRITDQYRKRNRNPVKAIPETDENPAPGEVQESDWEVIWDREWEQNLVSAAMDRVKKKVDPLHYQAFYLHVIKEWPVTKVGRTLKINAARIYLIKHRIGKLMKSELETLREQEF